MDKEEVKQLVLGLLCSDRKTQNELIDEYMADDVEFVHTLFSVRGKEAVRAIYRLATTSWNYRVEFKEVIREDKKMALYVMLKLKMPPFYILRYHFPTIVLLYFKQDPVTGRHVIAKQVDHHSVYVFTWLLGWPWIDLSQLVLRPLAGQFFAALGWVTDRALDALECAQAVASWLLQQATDASSWALQQATDTSWRMFDFMMTVALAALGLAWAVVEWMVALVVPQPRLPPSTHASTAYARYDNSPGKLSR